MTYTQTSPLCMLVLKPPDDTEIINATQISLLRNFVTNNTESKDPVDPAAFKIQVVPIITQCVPNFWKGSEMT